MKHTIELLDQASNRLQEMQDETGGLSYGKILSQLILGWPRNMPIVNTILRENEHAKSKTAK